jgi:predicted nucleic acid-binding protein
MAVLVDTSIWIDYFRSGVHSEKLDYLIDENLLVTNDLILTELLPLLILKKEPHIIELLQKVRKLPLELDWDNIVALQISCLRSGTSGVGIPDLIIAQNSIQNNLPVYSLDKHFRFIQKANIGLALYI